MWTPPHFWALALFMNDDYTKAGVPMFPCTHGCVVTRRYILVYTLLLAPIAIAAAFTSIGGPVYLAMALIMNAGFIWHAVKVWRRGEDAAKADTYKAERAMFKFSLLYLLLHFSALLIEGVLRSSGMGGW